MPATTNFKSSALSPANTLHKETRPCCNHFGNFPGSGRTKLLIPPKSQNYPYTCSLMIWVKIMWMQQQQQQQQQENEQEQEQQQQQQTQKSSQLCTLQSTNIKFTKKNPFQIMSLGSQWKSLDLPISNGLQAPPGPWKMKARILIPPAQRELNVSLWRTIYLCRGEGPKRAITRSQNRILIFPLTVFIVSMDS